MAIENLDVVRRVAKKTAKPSAFVSAFPVVAPIRRWYEADASKVARVKKFKPAESVRPWLVRLDGVWFVCLEPEMVKALEISFDDEVTLEE